MPVAEHFTHLGKKLLGSKGPDGAVGKAVALYEVAPVVHISGEGAVAAALGLLVVGPHPHEIRLDIGEDVLVSLGVEYEVLDDSESLSHVLAEAGERHHALVRTCGEAEITGEGIHAGGDVLGAACRRAEIVKIIEGRAEERAVLGAEVEYQFQSEYVILLVALVKQVNAVGKTLGGHVLGEVHEYRSHRLHLGGLDLLEECALVVAVGHDRRDLRRGYLLDLLVLSLALVHDGAGVVREVLLRESDHVILGDGLVALQFAGGVLPVHTVDERIHILLGAGRVVLKRTHPGQLDVVDRGGDESLVEVTGAQLRDLLEGDVFKLLHGLALLRASHDDEHAVVRTHVGAGAQIKGLLLLVDVDVDETRTAVAQYGGGDLRYGGGLEVRRPRKPPSHGKHFSLKPIHISHYRRGHFLLLLELELRHGRIRLPVAEILLDGGDHLVRVEIS